MKVFYSDQSVAGKCAGAIAKYALPQCELIELNSDKDFSQDGLQKGERLYFLGVTIEPFERFTNLATIYDVHWIDHRTPVINKYIRARTDDRTLKIKGLRSLDLETAQLTWTYLCREEPVPKSVYLIGQFERERYDDKEVIIFQTGLKSYNTDATNQPLWTLLFGDSTESQHEISKIIRRGRELLGKS
jgi:hypothetical protein